VVVHRSEDGVTDRRLSQRHADEQAVLEILNSRPIEMVYQPIFYLQDRAVLGHKALTRKSHSSPISEIEALFATADRMGYERDLDLVLPAGCHP